MAVKGIFYVGVDRNVLRPRRRRTGHDCSGSTQGFRAGCGTPPGSHGVQGFAHAAHPSHALGTALEL